MAHETSRARCRQEYAVYDDSDRRNADARRRRFGNDGGAVPILFQSGLFVFGSGLVIVPFLKTYVVDQYHWLSNRQFLDAVAIGMMSPGPVVITATFVGFFA